MKKLRLQQLFERARAEAAPVPPPDFAVVVLRAVRAEPPPRPAERLAVFGQLNQWFPRLAVAAVLLMLLCLAADAGLTAAGLPELGDGVSQAASQFVLAAEDL
jgi:hypothetical protein